MLENTGPGRLLLLSTYFLDYLSSYPLKFLNTYMNTYVGEKPYSTDTVSHGY